MSSKSGSPKLSIGLPVYNGERFLLQTLTCLLNQTFADFELIVCDNASSDNTEQICRHVAKRDKRIRYVRLERNMGAIANFNLAFELGRAPLYKWAAHDDDYAVSYLAECLEILDKNPDVVLAHTATAFINEKGKEFDRDEVSSAYIGPWVDAYRHPDSIEIGNSNRPSLRLWQVLRHAIWGTHMFGVMRRAVLEQTALLSNYVSSDRAMLAELALLGRFQSSSKCLFKKRFHPDVSWSLSQQEIKAKLDTNDTSYSRRTRQLQAFFQIPWNKPIGTSEKLLCTGLVAAHSMKVLREVLSGKDTRNEAHVRAWAQRNQRFV